MTSKEGHHEANAYRAGTVAVFVWYDEDRPTPNIQIMNQGQVPGATDLRSLLGI